MFITINPNGTITLDPFDSGDVAAVSRKFTAEELKELKEELKEKLKSPALLSANPSYSWDIQGEKLFGEKLFGHPVVMDDVAAVFTFLAGRWRAEREEQL